MKNEIEKLIVKYEDKSLEEPAYYFQYVEFVEDLQTPLKLWGKSVEGIINETTKDKAE